MPSPLILCFNHSSCQSTRTNHDYIRTNHEYKVQQYTKPLGIVMDILYIFFIVGIPYPQACLAFITCCMKMFLKSHLDM